MAFLRGDFHSDALDMNTCANIIVPDAKDNNEMNVLYLLHGLSDNCTGWSRLTSIERYANEANCVVIMPEVQRSFYTDMKYGVKYFSYVAVELPKIMHKLFNISNKPENTYVAGLSMGGYGALKCALSYPEKYAGCASFSGVCDIQASIDDSTTSISRNEIKAIFGEELKVGDNNDLFYLSTKANQSKEKPKIIMTCGTDDFLYQQNIKLRNHIEELNFEFEYQEWKDEHTWRFWDASIQLALDFFFNNDDN